jgi:hypothetical protein
MVFVLTNNLQGTLMTDINTIDTTSTSSDDQRRKTSARLAAAVEAAYILEAARR